MEPHRCDSSDKIQITKYFKVKDGTDPDFGCNSRDYDLIYVAKTSLTASAVYTHCMPFEGIFRDLFEELPNGYLLLKAMYPWALREFRWFVVYHTLRASDRPCETCKRCHPKKEKFLCLDNSGPRDDSDVPSAEEIESAALQPRIYKESRYPPRGPLSIHEMLDAMTLWRRVLVLVDLLGRTGQTSALVRYMRLRNVCDDDIALWISSIGVNYSLVNGPDAEGRVIPRPGLVILPKDTEAWEAFHWNGRRLFRDDDEPKSDIMVLTRALYKYEIYHWCIESVLSVALRIWARFGNPLVNCSAILPKLEAMARILRPDLDLDVSIDVDTGHVSVKKQNKSTP